MKKLFAAAIAVATIASGETNETKIATREWVERYVADAVASATATITKTGGVTVIEAGTGRNYMRLVLEDATDAALVATNCTAAAISAGVTNGLCFVWNGNGSYVNPAGFVTSTPSNLVFEGVASFPTNGVERFDGYFDVEPVLIQPSRSFSITNSAAGGSL